MKNFSGRAILFFGMFTALLLVSCGRGSATLPELSAKIFDAFKTSDEGKFIKCTPSKAQIEAAYMMYFSNGAKPMAIQKKSATDTANIISRKLVESFTGTVSTASAQNIDAKKAVLKDFKYEVKMRKESFNEAKLNLLIDNGSGKISTLACTAFQIKDKWYIIEGPRWK